MSWSRTSLRSCLGTLAWAAFCAADGGSAWAATVLPGSADAGRVQERTATPETPSLGRPNPVINTAVQPLPPVPAGQGFILRLVVFDGASAFPRAELADIVEPYIGQRVDVSSLNFIAGRITEFYAAHDYPLSEAVVPQQRVKHGIVHIAVIEGYIARVRVEGAPPHDRLGIVTATASKITALQPLSGAGLDRYVQLLNDLGGVQVTSVLEPLPAKDAPPGGIGLVLKFAPTTEPRSSLLINNFGSRYSGPWEATASTQFYSVANAFDTLTVTGLVAQPVQETKYLSLGYTLPVDAEGTDVLANANYAHSDPGFSLKDEEIVSDSIDWSAGLSHAFIRQRATTFSGTAIFEARDVATDILSTNLYRDRIRALRLTGHLEHADAWMGSSLLDVTMSQGINGLGASAPGSPDLSRAEGRSDFTKIAGTASRLQELGHGLQAMVMATGQYAGSPLLSSEEFGYGGQAFGRAYDPSEILGDDGAAASAELRYNGLPHIKSVNIQPFTFYDVGKVWNIASGGKELSGASVGAGLRLTLDNGVTGEIYGAFPMTRPASAPLEGNGKTMRLLMQIGWRF